MRWFAVLPFVLLAAAVPARDWATNVTAGADGAWTIGNPAARVKLTEYVSYTCPHCGHFTTESTPVLKNQMVRSGSTSLTIRHLVRDALDLAAVTIARCGGPAGFPARHAAIFAGQDTWMATGETFLRANGEALDKLDKPTAFRRIADGAGLTAIGKANGLTERQVAACFATQAALDSVAKLNASVPAEVQGTPTFYVDGTLVPNVDWAKLEPVLRARGAK
ncbi:thioredoxin domain-containing protein [Sphingomonas sp. Leaf343]|uniref:thioredoxin domain-containing protein n=1 Tax=Sphingomonas sp. Leaf343 TaxID=1736345 RepID=UPI0006FE14A9|nr:thioredoxin domain-containing protein [Sphingomonas sp. Leaf343]KQR80447.1 hypothetical protein ASG07_14945 [Sphingomonas sp. Leaf343]